TRRPPHRPGRAQLTHPVPRSPPACASGEPHRRHPVWRITVLTLALLGPAVQCSGVSWIWLVSPESLPSVPPEKRYARRCLSGRALARAAFGWEFPLSALSIAERVPRPAIAHVSSRPPYNAVRWVFPSTASRSGPTQFGLEPSAAPLRIYV